MVCLSILLQAEGGLSLTQFVPSASYLTVAFVFFVNAALSRLPISSWRNSADHAQVLRPVAYRQSPSLDVAVCRRGRRARMTRPPRSGQMSIIARYLACKRCRVLGWVRPLRQKHLPDPIGAAALSPVQPVLQSRYENVEQWYAGDRLADLIVIALVSFFLWSVVRALGWY